MKRILLVVDYQNDFVKGSLGFDKAVELEDRIAEKIEQYKNNGYEVVFTFDTHGEDYLSTQEGKNLPVRHCIKNTEGWNLYGKIYHMFDDDTKGFEKVTFGSMELANYLSKGGFQSVELVGVVSNICVISNAVLAKAALPEAEIIVDALCTASNDESLNEKALDVMSGMQIKVINR
ncbi:MAG: cysteine hydrolase family protein [Clostridium sp.]|uniref:cysteine hydrolase family protein n=1 Tax=Clostridium sp. TaxID=1506 RepID=UPI0025C4C375|nr:cysteine hydrolase family protein [Clostridium sp.]MCH3964433.1 cysteine hydrolase family protein [Clostridium sp.]MCI1715608.1 cysteine hydrolase family protein [Clostridium sp.]MCI1799600.1 cysteine hydrolase family protein [Clostridium sp.]MCI1813792.1 cysteine hydrolase family protein [Clostridium sp.]MCI1870413.1 cysteine hydrolase family protein [Clostridium sp.]